MERGGYSCEQCTYVGILRKLRKFVKNFNGATTRAVFFACKKWEYLKECNIYSR